MCSIKDVARRAGVSISTVSNVLNGTKRVSEELTRRVMIAVEELGYQANPIAKSMKSSKSHSVGIISTDIGGLFYPYIIKGLYGVLSQAGYSVQVFETDGARDPQHSWERVIEGVRRFVNYRMDGIVLTSIFPANMEEYYAQRILELAHREKKIPLISIETDFTRFGIDSIFADSFEGAIQATEHLIQKGCQKIAHITGPMFTRVSIERLAGFRSALEKANLPIIEDCIANGDYSHLSGYKAAKEILTKNTDFDGIFIANDQMALGAMRALRESGKRIPEDVKVIGYDDVFISSVLEPPLSTMHVLKRTMGERGAEVLLKRMQGDISEEQVVSVKLEARLVERRSTNAAAVDDWILSDW